MKNKKSISLNPKVFFKPQIWKNYIRPNLSNKKAVSFNLENLAVIVLSAICIYFLIVTIAHLYGVYSSKPAAQKAEETIDLISQKLYYFKGETIMEDSLLIYPPEDWYLKVYLQSPLQGICTGNKNCLCLCNNQECNSDKKCQGFDFNIGISYKELKTSGVIVFENSVEELKFNKEADKIIISLNEKK